MASTDATIECDRYGPLHVDYITDGVGFYSLGVGLNIWALNVGVSLSWRGHD